MLRRLVLIFIGLAVLGLAILGYLQWGRQAPMVRGGLEVWETGRDIANLPHYAAAALDYFSGENLNVTLVTAHHQAIASEGYQRADVVLGPPEQAWETDCRIFVQLTQHQHGFLVARKLEKAFAWADLKDHSVVAPGPATSMQVALETILRQENLRPQSDVIIIQNLPPHLQMGAYLAGSGSYILTTEPWATGLELAGQGQIAASLAAAGTLPGQVCVATPRAIRKKNDELARYTRAVAKAQEWLAHHEPSAIAAVVAPFFPQFNHENLTALIARSKEIDLWAPVPIPNQEQLAALQKAMVESGELKASLPYQRLTIPELPKRG